MVQKSTSQNLIQVCVGTVSVVRQYSMLERLNSWVKDIIKQNNPEPYYHLGFPCDFVGACVRKEGENHLHLYQLANKFAFTKGKQVSLVCQCTGDTVELDILPIQEIVQCLESSPLNFCQGPTSTATLIRDIPEGLIQIISDLLSIPLGLRDWTGLGAELGLSHNEIEIYRLKSNLCGELLFSWGSCTKDNIQNFLDIMRKLERLDVHDEVLAWIRSDHTPGHAPQDCMMSS